MTFPCARKLGNICCGHKMFLDKIRNIVCVPDTKFESATNAARADKWRNICVSNNVSATMVLVCQGLKTPPNEEWLRMEKINTDYKKRTWLKKIRWTFLDAQNLSVVPFSVRCTSPVLTRTSLIEFSMSSNSSFSSSSLKNKKMQNWQISYKRSNCWPSEIFQRSNQ